MELTGDYSEAFNYARTEPEASVLPAQRKIADRFRQLAAGAQSQLERDRLGYFAGLPVLRFRIAMPWTRRTSSIRF